MSKIRTTWSKPYSDNFESIFRKKKQPKETNVRIARVCDCDIIEHCPKCDPESEVFKTPKTSTKP
ncbi:MAG: hypothetical protein ACOYB3_01350 [Azonexus sp.]